jgi:hypothetical protein
MFQMKATETGPRGNLALEGITFTPDRNALVAIMEGALFDDASSPNVTAGSASRITVFNRSTGQASAQYAYPIDKVQATPVPGDQFTVNGPTEILAITNDRFLVLERSFSVGVIGNQVRLYEISLEGATNILSLPSLKTATPAFVWPADATWTELNRMPGSIAAKRAMRTKFTALKSCCLWACTTNGKRKKHEHC